MQGLDISPEIPAKRTTVFVAGTDTGVGKTLATAALLSILRANGTDAVPMKPIQTGCTIRKGTLVAPDLEFCLSTSGLRPDNTEKNMMTPYKFRPACSPHLAARLARTTIHPATIVKKCSDLKARHDFVVIEGAGGLLAPIGAGRTMLDLIIRLSSPVILVARSGLGTINHSLLSLQRLRQSKIEVLGIIFNQTQSGQPGYIESDNLTTVARYGAVRVLGSLPFVPHLEKLHREPAAFTKWAKTHLNNNLSIYSQTAENLL
ncbi:MAG: dethiobiotin synthase [bacterium]